MSKFLQVLMITEEFTKHYTILYYIMKSSTIGLQAKVYLKEPNAPLDGISMTMWKSTTLIFLKQCMEMQI